MDLEIVHTEPSQGLSNDYLRINHLGKIPSFVGEDGYELTESIAIAIYSMSASRLPHRPCRLSSYSLLSHDEKHHQTVIPV